MTFTTIQPRTRGENAIGCSMVPTAGITRLCAILTLFSAAFAAVSAAPPRPTDPLVSFGATAVTAAGVTPKGTVAFFAFGFNPLQTARETARLSAVVRDEHGDGTVTFQLTKPLPVVSICAVVDMTTGRVTIAGPPGYEFGRTIAPAGGLKRDATGAIERWDSGRTWVEVLCVRRGVGAWRGTVIDSDVRDGDGAATAMVRCSASRTRMA